MTEIEYKEGDIVWWNGGGLLIRCRIDHVEDEFRKKHPTSYLFYDLDEPVGHSVGGDDITTSFEEACEMFLAKYEERYDDEDIEDGVPECDLYEMRHTLLHFILSTHLPGSDWGKKYLITEEMIQERLKEYPVKERGKDWFTFGDIKSRSK